MNVFVKNRLKLAFFAAAKDTIADEELHWTKEMEEKHPLDFNDVMAEAAKEARIKGIR